jgi:hypothetical protein
MWVSESGRSRRFDSHSVRRGPARSLPKAVTAVRKSAPQCNVTYIIRWYELANARRRTYDQLAQNVTCVSDALNTDRYHAGLCMEYRPVQWDVMYGAKQMVDAALSKVRPVDGDSSGRNLVCHLPNVVAKRCMTTVCGQRAAHNFAVDSHEVSFNIFFSESRPRFVIASTCVHHHFTVDCLVYSNTHLHWALQPCCFTGRQVP